MPNQLHLQGQFWLKSDMNAFGQFGPISVLPFEEVTGTFTESRIKSLNKPKQPCEPDNQYSYNECLRSYVTDASNCSVDVLSNIFNCTSEGLLKLFNILNMIKSSSETDTMKTTGCLPKCTIHNYNFHKSNVEDAKWKKEWISSFYLSTKTTTYPQSEENYSYDDQVHSRYFMLLMCISFR